MDNMKQLKLNFFLLFFAFFIFVIMVRTPRKHVPIPQPRGAKKSCPSQISEQTITPLSDTKHFLVSAFMDQRVKDFDIRIISIFRRDSIQTLYCVFCCAGHLSRTTEASILVHSDHFDFLFGATDVMCRIPQNCNATHVTLLTQPNGVKTLNQSWLPIRNKNTSRKEEFQLNFTVCISSLFGKYNNVLQFAQTLEMYRLLGVGRVVIYNTSCGPELDRLLQSYTQEGFVEMVPWPIERYLNPSHGWILSRDGGELHYYGQVVKLNECIYRSMDRSRYVLLNDIDEIIMPYQHSDLMSLMDELQQQHPNTGMFLIKAHVFPKPFEESDKGPLDPWRGVPGFNILEHIYREEPDRSKHNPSKMIIQPRLVKQTSVHHVLKMFGQTYNVPQEICRMIHCKIRTSKQLDMKKLHVDTRLLDFRDQLIPRVNMVLRRAGLLSPEGKS